MAKEVLTKIEETTGFVALNEKDLPKTTDKKEFVENALNNAKFTSVDYKKRVKWLEYNGYEVTRENITNNHLPTVKLPE